MRRFILLFLLQIRMLLLYLLIRLPPVRGFDEKENYLLPCRAENACFQVLFAVVSSLARGEVRKLYC